MLLGSYPLYISLDAPLVGVGLRGNASRARLGKRRTDAGFSVTLEGIPRYLPKAQIWHLLSRVFMLPNATQTEGSNPVIFSHITCNIGVISTCSHVTRIV